MYENEKTGAIQPSKAYIQAEELASHLENSFDALDVNEIIALLRKIIRERRQESIDRHQKEIAAISSTMEGI